MLPRLELVLVPLALLVLTAAASRSPASQASSEPRSVTFEIRDARGSPIPGALVRIHRAEQALSAATSDEHGRAQAEIPRAQAWISLVLEDHELAAAGFDDEPPVPTFESFELPIDTLRVVLTVRPVPALHLELHDARTGRPIEHARVLVTWHGAGAAFARALRTRPGYADHAGPRSEADDPREAFEARGRGLYAVAGPSGPSALTPAFTRAVIEIAAEGYRAPEPFDVAFRAEEPRSRTSLALEPAADAVLVRGLFGTPEQPIADEELEAWRWTGQGERAALLLGWRGRTDAEGTFVFPCRRERTDDLVVVRATRRDTCALAGPLPLGAAEERELRILPAPWKSMPVVVYATEPGVRYQEVLALEERGLALELLTLPVSPTADGSPHAGLFAVPPYPRRAFRLSVGLADPRFGEPVWSNVVEYDGTQGAPLELTVRDTLVLAGRVEHLPAAARRTHAIYVADVGSDRTLAIGLIGESGEFRISGLPPRSYRVVLSPHRSPWGEPQVERELDLRRDVWDLVLAAPRPEPEEQAAPPGTRTPR